MSATYGDIGDLRLKRRDSVARGEAIAAMRAPKGGDGRVELDRALRRGGEWIDPRPLMRTEEPPSEDGGDLLSAK